MKRRHAVILSLLVAVGAPAPGLAEEFPEPDAPALREMTADYARCAGFWTWFSEWSIRSGKPASGAYIKTYANGAYTSALWLMSTHYFLENPGAPPRTYGSFGPAIDGLVETERLRLTALEEQADGQALLDRHGRCEAMTAGSEAIIQEMRKEAHGVP